MYKIFQPIVSANFLKILEDSAIGKALIEKTGMSAFKMLNRFKLNLPTESNPTAWLIEGDTKFSYHLYDITLFLKHAWLYSECEKNEHIDNLKRTVADEITSFEKDLIIEGIQRELKLKQQKEKELSIRNSTSASKSSGCKDVSEFFEKLVVNNPNKRRTKREFWMSEVLHSPSQAR
jgi:hypothetical protein